MFESFDIIRIISLPQREDRRSEMRRELARAGLAGDPRIEFFDAVRPHSAGKFSSIGARGCYWSHVGVLEEASRLGSSVLIVEDDCDFVANVRDQHLAVGWQMFYGGYVAADVQDLQNSDITGSYAMGISADLAPRLARYLKELDVDVQHPPIDAAYVWFRRANPDVLTYFSDPPIGQQRPSRSDIEPGAFYNRIVGIRELVELARKTRRRVAGRRIDER